MNQNNLQTDLKFTTEINLYYDFYKPEKVEKKLPPLLIAVHGYGAHKRYMMREGRFITANNFAVVSLQAPHQHYHQTDSGYRVGFGWLTDYKPEESIAVHHKFILDVVKKLSDDELIDRNKIFLFGFSQACALNFRFALTHREILRGVLGVCGGIPSDLETNADYQPTNADVFYLYSRQDEFYPREKFENFDSMLKNYLPNYQSKSYEAKHEITNEMRDDLKNWLQSKSI